MIKREKIINVRFTKDEWKEVCDRAEMIGMKKSAFMRNMSLHKVWKISDTEAICKTLKNFNLMGSLIRQIIKVAEETKSEHLEELKHQHSRFEKCRAKLIDHYSGLMNKEEDCE